MISWFWYFLHNRYFNYFNIFFTDISSNNSLLAENQRSYLQHVLCIIFWGNNDWNFYNSGNINKIVQLLEQILEFLSYCSFNSSLLQTLSWQVVINVNSQYPDGRIIFTPVNIPTRKEKFLFFFANGLDCKGFFFFFFIWRHRNILENLYHLRNFWENRFCLEFIIHVFPTNINVD